MYVMDFYKSEGPHHVCLSMVHGLEHADDNLIKIKIIIMIIIMIMIIRH